MRNIRRNYVRSSLTVTGVAISIFMFCAILNLNDSVHSVIDKSSGAKTLVVFQKNRY